MRAAAGHQRRAGRSGPGRCRPARRRRRAGSAPARPPAAPGRRPAARRPPVPARPGRRRRCRGCVASRRASTCTYSSRKPAAATQSAPVAAPAELGQRRAARCPARPRAAAGRAARRRTPGSARACAQRRRPADRAASARVEHLADHRVLLGAGEQPGRRLARARPRPRRSSPKAYAGKVRTTGSDMVRAVRLSRPIRASIRLRSAAAASPAERQHQDLVRVDALGDPGGHRLDQRRRLAGARPADHEQRAGPVGHDRQLRRVEGDGGGGLAIRAPARAGSGAAADGSAVTDPSPSTPPPQPRVPCNHAPPTTHGSGVSFMTPPPHPPPRDHEPRVMIGAVSTPQLHDRRDLGGAAAAFVGGGLRCSRSVTAGAPSRSGRVDVVQHFHGFCCLARPGTQQNPPPPSRRSRTIQRDWRSTNVETSLIHDYPCHGKPPRTNGRELISESRPLVLDRGGGRTARNAAGAARPAPNERRGSPMANPDHEVGVMIAPKGCG